MAIEALDEIGLRDARFDINDARVVDGILDGRRARPARTPSRPRR